MNSYDGQDRGDSEAYKEYIEAMDAIALEKVASASVFFNNQKGKTIVDVGMASGTSSAILAHLFPNAEIVGVDINPKMLEYAQEHYQQENLSFRLDDGEKLESFEKSSVHGFFNCSAIHHITSYNDYDTNRAWNALKRQAELLEPNGILVVRDFVKPEEQEVFIELSTGQKANRPSDVDLFIRFSKEARSLNDSDVRGFPIVEYPSENPDSKRFRAFLTDVTEFIRRKDYFDNWDVELQEEYGYYSQKEFEQIFRDLGLRVVLSAPIYNRWIINNRYKGQFRIFDLNNNEIGYLPTNYLIVGEKVQHNRLISLTRHLPIVKSSFLNFSSYKNQISNEIYDLVSRPNDVVDILPYCISGDQVYVLVRKNHPRPLVTRNIDQALDGKFYSGYMTECITKLLTNDWREKLENDLHASEIEKNLAYYSSPGGISERIESYFVKCDEMQSGNNDYYHWENAIGLINTAQTGALADARLLLNCYTLLDKLKIKYPKWLSEPVAISEGFAVVKDSVSDLLQQESKAFVESEENANFLKMYRAQFTVLDVEESKDIALEYVFPEGKSIHTLVTLPINFYEGKLYVGLELRELPVPQLFSGNAKLLTVPAQRLSKSIRNYFDLEHHLENSLFDQAKIKSYNKLGEKYFASSGITPEQVYPYVVQYVNPPQNINWVSWDDLQSNIQYLEDGHLLIAITRLQHALKDVDMSFV